MHVTLKLSCFSSVAPPLSALQVRFCCLSGLAWLVTHFWHEENLIWSRAPKPCKGTLCALNTFYFFLFFLNLVYIMLFTSNTCKNKLYLFISANPTDTLMLFTNVASPAPKKDNKYFSILNVLIILAQCFVHESKFTKNTFFVAFLKEIKHYIILYFSMIKKAIKTLNLCYSA